MWNRKELLVVSNKCVIGKFGIQLYWEQIFAGIEMLSLDICPVVKYSNEHFNFLSYSGLLTTAMILQCLRE